MKKILLSLAALSLLAGTPCMAALQDFSSPAGSYVVEVPSGWKLSPISNGCQILSSDGKNSMSVQIFTAGDEKPKEFADRIAASIGLTTVKEERGEYHIAQIDGTLENGLSCGVTVIKFKGLFVASVLAGPNRGIMKQIVGTVRPASQR